MRGYESLWIGLDRVVDVKVVVQAPSLALNYTLDDVIHTSKHPGIPQVTSLVHARTQVLNFTTDGVTRTPTKPGNHSCKIDDVSEVVSRHSATQWMTSHIAYYPLLLSKVSNVETVLTQETK